MIPSIKAILEKELKENRLWAMLIAVMTTAALAVGVDGGIQSGLPLIQKSLLTICMLMYPLAGMSLGWMQIYQDFRPGRWQFVTHRPVSHNLLFAGKILAGLALYFAATLIPFGLMVGAISIPGYTTGPFTWDMTLPVLAYVFSGLMWYATGLLVAARRARWYGSRIMPVGIAIAGTIAFNNLAMTFVMAVAIMLPCFALLLAAAWGAFVAGDEPSRIPAWSKPWIGVALAVGWILTVAVTTGFIGEVAGPLVEVRNDAYSHYYELDQDGNLTTDDNHTPGRNALARTTLFLGSVHNAETEGFLNPDTHARRFCSNGGETWYYVACRQALEGFRDRDARPVGSLGRDGFAPPGQPTKPFGQVVTSGYSGFNDWGELLVVTNAVFVVNTLNRQVREIFSSPSDDPVIAINNLPAFETNPDNPPGNVVIATASKFHFLHDFREVLAIPRDQRDTSSNVTVGIPQDDGQFVVAYGAVGPVGWNPVSVRIYDQAGKLVRQTDVPAKPVTIPRDTYPMWYEAGLFIPSPPTFFVVTYTLHSLDRGVFLLRTWALLPLVIAGYPVIALLMLRARHATRGQFILWTILAAALGLSGILLLVSMFEKPKSVRCTGCGKRRLVTESACPNCHTPAPAPPMEGIEIFEPDVCGAA